MIWEPAQRNMCMRPTGTLMTSPSYVALWCILYIKLHVLKPDKLVCR